ncbi:MAG: serine/threonine-protein phosphatase, partial [Deltaproteobacteria bacterium]|nr:serine/threonine-protein phosphatase [Deltaproteobacteria bacterium]
WYFVNVGESGKVTLQIADVTGHGLSAALIGSMSKLALSAAGREVPHELLGQMNRLMSPQLPAGRFVTVSSCLYDPASGEIDFARAGHPPGFVLHRATGTVEQLKGSGFPLGFIPDGEYSHEKSKLEVGDVLMLITDGISEASNRSNELYGFDRLSAALAASKPEAGVAHIIETVLSDFDRFRDERMLKDDVTIVALKRLK